MFNITFPEGRRFNGVYLSVKFQNGQGQTDSDYLAKRFEGKGLNVERVEEERKEKPLSKMTKVELEEKAVGIGLDLSDCNNNEERAKKIEDYLNKPEEEQTEGEDNGENAE